MKNTTWITGRTVTLSRLEYEELQLAKAELAYLKFNKRRENFINTKVAGSFNLWSKESPEKKFQKIVNYLFSVAARENFNAIMVSSNFLDYLSSTGLSNRKCLNGNIIYGKQVICEKICINTFGQYNSDGIEYIGFLKKALREGENSNTAINEKTPPILNIFVGDFITGDSFLVLASSEKKARKRKASLDCTFDTLKKYQIICNTTSKIQQLDLKAQFNKNAELLIEVNTQKKYLVGDNKWKRLK